MPLSDIQFKEALRRATVEVLKEGKVPSLSKTIKTLQKRFDNETATPTVRVREQGRRSQWNLDGMNHFMSEVDFDLVVLYQALLELSNRVLRRLNLVETSTRAQHAQIDRIEGLARNLLFVIQNGDGYFSAHFDDFHDLSKVDLVRSTREVVDLASHTAELPDASPNTRKYSLTHMASAMSWGYNVKADSQILSAETPNDAKFNNLFLDTISMWRHDVVTKEAGPVSLEFTFPVHHQAGGELSLSRIQVVGVSEFAQQLEVSYSIDGVNYLSFPNTSNTVELEKSSRAVNIDFPLTRVEFLRFKLYRSNHDKILASGFLTSFGLRNISLFSIGRSFNAEIVSKIFPVPDEETLNKVALSVSEEVPAGTDIKYYVSVLTKETVDDDQLLTDGKWSPITPITRAAKPDEPPRVIRVSSLSNKNYTFIPKSPVSHILEYKGQKFYALNGVTDTHTPALITDDYVFGTCFLERGRNAWLRQKSGENTIFNVLGNFISFSSSTRQKLYTTALENVGFASPLTLNNIERTVVEVSRPIDYRFNAGMSVIPPAGVDPYSIPDPLHAVYKVELTTPSQEYQEVVTFPNTTNGKYKLTKGPIEIQETSKEETYLSAYRPNLNTHDDALIAALEARPGLSDYHGNVIKSITSLTTPADIAAGKPQLTRFTVGTSDSNPVTQERTITGEVVSSTAIPSPSKKTLAELTDQQLLNQFGKIKVAVKNIQGIYGVSASDPTRIYMPGEHFELFNIQDPVTGITDLYVARAPDNPARAISIAVGETVTFKFKYKKDLTQHVVSVDGNKIFFDKKFTDFTNANSGFRLNVGYRFVPTGTNEVIKSTLVVAPKVGGAPYIEGKDYHFNPKDGTITQIPTGSIQQVNGKTTAYASFSYKGPASSLETYTIWVYVNSRDPIKVHYEQLSIDTEYGEKVLVSTGNGSVVDISGTTETPELQFGWHQFTVISRNPDIFTATAIKKVAELVDINDEPVFLAGGKYFSKMLGSRTPLTQVPVDYLKNSILPTDHSKFAIDEDGYVIVNFQPNDQEDYYTYGFRLEPAGSLLENTAQNYDEEFNLDYLYHKDEARKVDGVMFKAVLSRSQDADNSLTPKLNGYQLRIG